MRLHVVAIPFSSNPRSISSAPRTPTVPYCTDLEKICAMFEGLNSVFGNNHVLSYSKTWPYFRRTRNGINHVKTELTRIKQTAYGILMYGTCSLDVMSVTPIGSTKTKKRTNTI